MKWKHAAAAGAALVVAVGAVSVIMNYRQGSGFHPTNSNRELQNNQVLFPDGETMTGQQEQTGENDNSFWERDDNGEDSAQQGADSGYLFDQDQQTPTGEASGSLVQDGAIAAPGGTTAGTVTGGDIYEITDGSAGGNPDLILPGGGSAGGLIPGGNGDGDISGGTTGGGTGTGGSGNSGSSSGGTGGGSGSGENGGINGGTTGGGTVATPAEGTTVTPDPIPGNGSSSKDPEDSKILPVPDGFFGDQHPYDESVLPDDTTWWTAMINQSATFGTAQMYRGQSGLDQKSIFNMLETYVTNGDWDNPATYVWGADALNKYVRIDAVAFDDREKTTEFPVNIPDGAKLMKIYASYRLRNTPEEEWIPYEGYDYDYGYVDYVPYKLAQARVLVLKEILESQGQQITTDMIFNYDDNHQYPSQDTSDVLNLLRYQEKLLGGQGTRLTTLFPGWKEDGVLVPFCYPITAGRHVLEPAGLVSLDERYQVEMERYWVDDDYSISQNASTYSYLQTLTKYSGETNTTEEGDKLLAKLTVPKYVQAVAFNYFPALIVDNLDLPDTVFYVDTNGVPSYLDDEWLYGRGLQVRSSYTVAAGNPRYTAEDGLLYSLDKTELLGVPTGRTSLTVGADVTTVLLPYQNQLTELVLETTDIDNLPDINYSRLSRKCRIIVPDEILNDFMTAESAMLKRTGLTVYPASQRDQGYTLSGDFLLDANGVLEKVQRENIHWLSLTDAVTGVSKAAMEDLQEKLAVLLLPQNGKVITFEDGCFNGYEKLTLACYSDEQEAAARALAETQENLNVRRVTVREDGYSYLDLNDDQDTLLLAVPYGIKEFRGTIPMEDGSEKLVTVIGDGVFADSYALRWVILPEETKAIGYQAFKDCANLEGVLIDSRDVFLLCNEAFDNCTTLRFVASNAFKMLLEDTDLDLPSDDVWGVYGFLLCPPLQEPGSQYNDGNWCSVDGVETYDLVDCGGTYVLYGADEEGVDWIALRSGKRVSGEVTLLDSTEMIYQEAFQDARTTNDTFFTVNWADLENLGMIWRSAFKGSDLGEDLVLPVDLELQSYAFNGCTKIKTVVLPGSTPAEGIRMGQEIFAGCTALREVSLGAMNTYDGLDGTTFGNCTSLERINFLSRQAPKLISGEGGLLYYFQYDQEEKGNLTIAVPEGTEEDYIRAWRYAMAGYYASSYESAYQAMINGVARKLSDELWYAGIPRDPSDEEIMDEVNRLLLQSENRLRTLMGLPTVEAVQRAYRYTVDDEGMVTLVAAHHIGDYTDLSAAEMELPDAWALDYVAADAFKESPELRVVAVPDTLVGFHSNAFRGLEFDENVSDDGLLLILDGDIFDLIIEGEGVPFTFGVDEDRVRVTSLPLLNGDDDISYYVKFWTLPMAGYSSVDTMRTAITEELTRDGEAPDDETVQAELEARLLEAENRVRRLLDWEETDELTFEIPEEPVGPDGTGELPDAVLPDPTDPENPDETEEPEEQPTEENPDGDTSKDEDDQADGETPADETDETEQEEQEETPA